MRGFTPWYLEPSPEILLKNGEKKGNAGQYCFCSTAKFLNHWPKAYCLEVNEITM